MRSRNAWELLLLLFTATACSPQPSTQQLANELKTVTSWTATAHKVGDFWLQGSIPQAYAQRTLETAGKKLHEEIDTLVKVAPPENRNTVIARVQKLTETVEQMAKTVGRQDRNALTREIGELSEREQEIRSLAKTVGNQP
ncbi:MAG: hypothetical protein RMX96_24275 [Nostoc sp. ChiSLP02]|nr:hypothetical protein [Nostoc sp. DedSLP05]MDZ8097963.1 hypothetical protein [Nostoc sp. DedSLP01]MDZ8187954.1 hypothetical protein [Nostoc sp. ChiSLP02]